MKILTLILQLAVIVPQISFAMAQRPPATPAPNAPTEPAASNNAFEPEGFDVFTDVSYPMGSAVDSSYSKYRELIPLRRAQEAHATDKCDPRLGTKDRFADRIAYAVNLKMQPSRAQLGYVASYFGLSSDVSSYLPNSLISHPLCNVTTQTLETTLNGKNVPGAATIKKANDFANKINQYRREAIAGNTDGYVKAARLWSKYMMCLSYMESLTTADTAKAESVASKYAPSGYRRPAGVNFYEDPYQPAASKLNIGIFQFTPDAGGNIQACIREWNQLYPQCGIARNASSSELIRVLGSSLQTFNSFCAAAKVTGMFAVQVNTTKSYNTHPYNVVNGSLKAPRDRCVSPHVNVARSYNHFAPFQNGSGFTLDTILSCTMAGE